MITLRWITVNGTGLNLAVRLLTRRKYHCGVVKNPLKRHVDNRSWFTFRRREGVGDETRRRSLHTRHTRHTRHTCHAAARAGELMKPGSRSGGDALGGTGTRFGVAGAGRAVAARVGGTGGGQGSAV